MAYISIKQYYETHGCSILLKETDIYSYSRTKIPFTCANNHIISGLSHKTFTNRINNSYHVCNICKNIEVLDKLGAKYIRMEGNKVIYECKCGNITKICKYYMKRKTTFCMKCKYTEEAAVKLRATNRLKYGTDYGVENSDIKKKIVTSNMEKFGVTCVLQNPEIRKKIAATVLEKYGFEYSAQSQQVKDKTKANNLLKYGYEYIMQNPEIFTRQQKSGFRIKTYTFPSGKEIKVQGYEPYALNLLLKTYQEDDIKTALNDKLPEIWYTNPVTNKASRYFPDIYITSENSIIEVKSTYTYEHFKEITDAKLKACFDKGYDTYLYVFSKEKLLYMHIYRKNIVLK